MNPPGNRQEQADHHSDRLRLDGGRERSPGSRVIAFCSKPIFMSELRNILSNPYYVEKKDAPKDSDAEQFAGRKILLVEDNELNMEIAAELLQEAGFNLKRHLTAPKRWRK